MEMLENSAVYLFVLFGGYVLKRFGVFDADDARTLSKIIMKITLPRTLAHPRDVHAPRPSLFSADDTAYTEY